MGILGGNDAIREHNQLNREEEHRKMSQQITQWTLEVLHKVNYYYYGYVLFICRCHHYFPPAV